MWTKSKLRQLMALIAFTMLSAGCGTPIVVESTIPVDKSVETSLVGTIGSKVGLTEVKESSVEENLDSDTTSTSTDSSTTTLTTDTTKTLSSTTSLVIDSTPSTTLVTTTTVMSKVFSPAWTESQVLLSKYSSDSLEDRRFINDYWSDNPNEVSTPMGALCWAYHELSGGFDKSSLRNILDYFIIPFFMDEAGIDSEQFGTPGREATGALLYSISGNSGPVGFTDDSSDGPTSLPDGSGAVGPVGSINESDIVADESIGFLLMQHEFAGDGTAWSVAIDAVASPEIVTAFRAGEGLPADVQVYADALVAFVREHVGKDVDISAESDDMSFALPGFPGIESFIETAKYHQDCKRAWIGDL